MDLGFLSSLGEETDPDTECDHTYDTPQPGVCVAHIRDRGESPEISATESFENLTDALECAEDMNCDYAYSWDGCKWTCHDLDEGGQLEPFRTYRFTCPPTLQMGSYAGVCRGTLMEHPSDNALWYYNSARSHDGLPPVTSLPAGTKFRLVVDDGDDPPAQ